MGKRRPAAACRDRDGAARLARAPGGVRTPFDLDRVVSAFERVTGKSFGELPMNPMLSSDSRVIERDTARRIEILNTWAQWWDWTPKP